MSSLIRILSLSARSINNYFTKRPFCVSFEITYRCNAWCKHCHLHDLKDKELASSERYAEICREIKPVVAQVSGGEPLLREDLDQIIKGLKRTNRAPFIVLTTNGVLLSKERYYQLRESGVDEFSLSLDYPDARHDEFRSVPGLFNRLEKLMAGLNTGNDKAITISCVIQRDNYRDLLGIAELARKWDIHANFSTYTWLRTKNKDFMIPKDEVEEFKGFIEKLIEYKRKFRNIRTSDYVLKKIPDFFINERIPDCRAGERFLVVNPDGTISPCGLIIKNYLSQKQLQDNFAKTSRCEECYTSIRANTEKPLWYSIKDSLSSI